MDICLKIKKRNSIEFLFLLYFYIQLNNIPKLTILIHISLNKEEQNYIN